MKGVTAEPTSVQTRGGAALEVADAEKRKHSSYSTLNLCVGREKNCAINTFLTSKYLTIQR